MPGILYGIDETVSPKYDFTDIVRTYKGNYMPSWGISGLDLTITSLDIETGAVKAEFSFYPHTHGSANSPTGKYSLTGRVVYQSLDGRAC